MEMNIITTTLLNHKFSWQKYWDIINVCLKINVLISKVVDKICKLNEIGWLKFYIFLLFGFSTQQGNRSGLWEGRHSMKGK